MKKVLFEKMTTKTILYPLMIGGVLFAPCSNVFAEELQSENSSITDSQYQARFMQRVASLYKSLSGNDSEDYIPQSIIKFATEHKDEGVKTVALTTAELIQLSNEIKVLGSDANSSTSVSGEGKEEILTEIKEVITERTAEIVVQEAEKKAAVKPQAEKRAEVKEKLTSAIGETNKTAEICSIIVQTQKGSVENTFGTKSKEAVNDLFNLATKEFETASASAVSTNDTTNLNQSAELDTKIKEVVSKIETQVVADENRKLAAEAIVNQAEKQIQEKAATNPTPASSNTPSTSSPYSGGSYTSAREATINMVSRAIEISKDDSSISAGIIQSDKIQDNSSTNELINLASTALNTSKQISESNNSDRIAALEKDLAAVKSDFEQKLKAVTDELKKKVEELNSLKGTGSAQSMSSVPSNIPTPPNLGGMPSSSIPAPPNLGGMPSSSIPIPPNLGGMPTKSKINNSQPAKAPAINNQQQQQKSAQQQLAQQQLAQQQLAQQSPLTAAEKETKINDLYDNKNRTAQQSDELKKMIKERLSEIGKAKTVIEGLQVKQYNKILSELQQSTTTQQTSQQQQSTQQANQQQSTQQQATQQQSAKKAAVPQKPKQEYELKKEISILDGKKNLTIDETKQLDQALSDMLKLLNDKKINGKLDFIGELNIISYQEMKKEAQAVLSKSSTPASASGSGSPGGSSTGSAQPSSSNPAPSGAATTTSGTGSTGSPANTSASTGGTSTSTSGGTGSPANTSSPITASSPLNTPIPTPPNPGGMPSTTTKTGSSSSTGNASASGGSAPAATNGTTPITANSPLNTPIPTPPNPGGMPSTTTKTGSNSSTGNASASGGSAPAAANTNPDPTKAPEKPKDLLEEIRNFSKDSLNNPTEKKAEEKAEESKSKSWTDELAETMAKRNAAINGSDDEDGGDENDSSSDAGDDQDWSLDKELSDSDIAPASEIDWSLARMEYLKKQIDIVNYEALAKAVKRADAKKISEITKSINAADTAMQKGNKEQIISMAKEAIKKNAENIKSYTPYWTAAEIAKKYLSVGATESIPENMTEEDIKKVCVINYLYAKNSAGGVDVNVADINDVEKSVGIIKALCEKLNEDGLVSSADYFNSLIYKQGTDKELDRDNIKGIMAVSLAMAMAEKEDVTNAAGHAKMINEITSVPSDITDSNQIEAWKEIVKKYYSSL